MQFFFRSRKLIFTKEGKIFTSLCIAVGIAAINTGSNLLFLILGMMLSIIIASGVISESVFRKITVKRNLPRLVKCLEGTLLRYELINEKKIFPSFCFTLADSISGSDVMFIPKIGPKEAIHATKEVSFNHRGLIELTKLTFKTSYPFGFFEKEKVLSVNDKLIVLPVIKNISEKPFKSSFRSALNFPSNYYLNEAEFFRGLREYRIGDNPKRIHWKSLARYLSPMIKEYEISSSMCILVLLDTLLPVKMNGTDESERIFESAVCLCASIIANIFESRLTMSLGLVKKSGIDFYKADYKSDNLSLMLEKLAIIQPEYSESCIPENLSPDSNSKYQDVSICSVSLTNDSERYLKTKLSRQTTPLVFLNMSDPLLQSQFYPY